MVSVTTPNGETVEAEVLASLPMLIGLIAGGKLTGINSTIDTAVATGSADIEADLDKLRTELDADVAASPLASAAKASLLGVLSALGLSVPSETAVVAALKAAVAQLAGVIVAATPATPAA